MDQSVTASPDPVALFKQQSAERAVEYIQSGMIVGLGTGTTAIFALARIAQLQRQGNLQNILGVPTSKHAAADAASFGIPLTTL